MNNADDREHQPKLDELISTRHAAKLLALTQPHVALLIRKGALWGQKIGRNWVTTEKAVRAYQARNRRPGPQPKHYATPS